MRVFNESRRQEMIEAADVGPEAHDPDSYFARLKARNFEVSPEELTAHEHFLEEFGPLYKVLSRFRDHQHTGAGHRWTDKEEKVLEEAVRVLKRSLLPLALFKEKKKSTMKKLKP